MLIVIRIFPDEDQLFSVTLVTEVMALIALNLKHYKSLNLLL